MLCPHCFRWWRWSRVSSWILKCSDIREFRRAQYYWRQTRSRTRPRLEIGNCGTASRKCCYCHPHYNRWRSCHQELLVQSPCPWVSVRCRWPKVRWRSIDQSTKRRCHQWRIQLGSRRPAVQWANLSRSKTQVTSCTRRREDWRRNQ
jgi:hypothetical protein